jgi:tetratricopeptide (TPR) repeat protein
LALLAAGLLSASIDWMWELVAVFGVVVVAAALLTGGATAEEGIRQQGRLSAAFARRPLAFAVATGLLAWAALWCSGDLMLTRMKLEESSSAAAAGRLRDAADAANDAVALQPWAADPRLQLGLVQEAAGNREQAAATLRGAAERAPDDWEVWFALGRVEFESHDFAASRAALAQARRTNPRSRTVRHGVDMLLLRMRVAALPNNLSGQLPSGVRR